MIYETVADVTVEPDSILTNTARVIWTSTADDPAGEERTGAGPNPDDHFTDSQESISTNTPAFAKFLTSPGTDYAVGDLITYTARFTTPLGTTRNIIFTDTLPNGLKYITGTTDISGPSAFAEHDQSHHQRGQPQHGQHPVDLGTVHRHQSDCQPPDDPGHLHRLCGGCGGQPRRPDP